MKIGLFRKFRSYGIREREASKHMHRKRQIHEISAYIDLKVILLLQTKMNWRLRHPSPSTKSFKIFSFLVYIAQFVGRVVRMWTKANHKLIAYIFNFQFALGKWGRECRAKIVVGDDSALCIVNGQFSFSVIVVGAVDSFCMRPSNGCRCLNRTLAILFIALYFFFYSHTGLECMDWMSVCAQCLHCGQSILFL